MPKARIITADVLDGLRTLEEESFQCCACSPPYWGLRDYGTATWEGGDAGCDHKRVDKAGTSSSGLEGGKGNVHHGHEAHYTSACAKCGARRVDDQLGLEKTPEEYTAKMVEVFREVRRVLREDGVCFLNLGDSYCGSGPNRQTGLSGTRANHTGEGVDSRAGLPGLKPKDLVGVPWRVAFALQSDGWWLRSATVWAKGMSFCPTYSGSVMPESPKDRPTSAYEMVFVLTKSARYFYDGEAVKERQVCGDHRRVKSHNATVPSPMPGAAPHTGLRRGNKQDALGKQTHTGFNERWRENPADGRNLRNVWAINPEPFPGEFCAACKRFYADGGRHLAVHRDEETEREYKICACGRWDSWVSHFACFPQTLVEPMVKAGTCEKGCCPECGKPWERVVEREAAERDDSGRTHSLPEQRMGKTPPPEKGWESKRRTVGFRSACECGSVDPVPCAILDPFMGAGTTGLVSLKLGRDFTGIELNPDYAEMARKRILQDAPLFNEVVVETLEDSPDECDDCAHGGPENCHGCMDK